MSREKVIRYDVEIDVDDTVLNATPKGTWVLWDTCESLLSEVEELEKKKRVAEKQRDDMYALHVQDEKTRKDRDSLKARLEEQRISMQEVREVNAELRCVCDSLEAKLEEAEKRQQRYWCIYCGEVFRFSGVKETDDKILKAHVEICEKHPLFQARADRDRLREKVDAADALVAVAISQKVDEPVNGYLVPTKEWNALCALYPQPAQEEDQGDG